MCGPPSCLPPPGPPLPFTEGHPMPVLDKTAPLSTLTVTPWSDRVVDALGHDPRSAYAETFWLPIVGPSTTLFLRRVAHELDRQPEGFDLVINDVALALGLGGRGGRNSPFVRTIARSCQFELAQMCGSSGLAVRRKLPPLTRVQVQRLPGPLRAEHHRWHELDLRIPSVEQRRRRARRLALSLIELGEPRDVTEQQLHQWHFHPAMACEATEWAWDHHRVLSGPALPGVPADPTASMAAGPGAGPPPASVVAAGNPGEIEPGPS